MKDNHFLPDTDQGKVGRRQKKQNGAKPASVWIVVIVLLIMIAFAVMKYPHVFHIIFP